MTRKNYEKIAVALRGTQPSNPGEPRKYTATLILSGDLVQSIWRTKQWQDDVKSIADVLAVNNTRFDRDRFYAACGMETGNPGGESGATGGDGGGSGDDGA